ncbi:hypothetical protein A7U60_g6889 [Sanghuangporus baumii]|uniref:Uncharacterized protein n=1 Tax=Sanghuangporus baumii TaxID=108892 RepID=A0A9Q5HUA4_SANBA|nr:hypothetical protein A7U60_g6889 [Sanghuangporus baumii]
MSSDDIHVEPHVLKFINENDESVSRRPIDPVSPSTPPLKLAFRKLSEPAHKSSSPIKPILKSKGSVPDTNPSTQKDPRRLRTSAVQSNVPLRFASRKAPPAVDATPIQEVMINYTASYESDKELFYTPGSVKDDTGEGANKDYLTSRQKSTTQTDRQSENFFKGPPAPLPTPTLRTSFSQDVPYQGYPLTPRNTFRGRRTPPIVDELDHKRNSGQFPSRQSFTFSPPPETPSPSEFPLPPSLPKASKDGNATQSASTTQQTGPKNNVSSRRLSWHPTFKRRSVLKTTPERPEPTRLSSKRKSNSEAELSTKRRKVVKFDLPPDHKQHPPMKRRPTPYYEPLSARIKRFFRSLIAPFVKTEEEKEQERAHKEAKKAAKRARKEREELEDSFKNFDDTFD